MILHNAEEGTFEPVRCVDLTRREASQHPCYHSLLESSGPSSACHKQTDPSKPHPFMHAPWHTPSFTNSPFPTCIIVNCACALFLLLSCQGFEEMECVHFTFASPSIKPRTGPSLASNIRLEYVDKCVSWATRFWIMFSRWNVYRFLQTLNKIFIKRPTMCEAFVLSVRDKSGMHRHGPALMKLTI